MVKLVNKEYVADDQTMSTYFIEVRNLEGRFDGLDFKFISQKDNYIIDALTCQASSRALGPPEIFVERISRPSVIVPAIPGQSPITPLLHRQHGAQVTNAP